MWIKKNYIFDNFVFQSCHHGVVTGMANYRRQGKVQSLDIITPNKFNSVIQKDYT